MIHWGDEQGATREGQRKIALRRLNEMAKEDRKRSAQARVAPAPVALDSVAFWVFIVAFFAMVFAQLFVSTHQ